MWPGFARWPDFFRCGGPEDSRRKRFIGFTRAVEHQAVQGREYARVQTGRGARHAVCEICEKTGFKKSEETLIGVLSQARLSERSPDVVKRNPGKNGRKNVKKKWDASLLVQDHACDYAALIAPTRAPGARRGAVPEIGSEAPEAVQQGTGRSRKTTRVVIALVKMRSNF